MNDIKALNKYIHVFSKKPKHFRTIMKQLSLDEETIGIIISMLITLTRIEEIRPLEYQLRDLGYKPLPI